jgi:hypothetical protein
VLQVPRPSQQKAHHHVFFIPIIQAPDDEGPRRQVFFVLVIQVRLLFYLFFGVGKKFILFVLQFLATLVDAKSKKSKDT